MKKYKKNEQKGLKGKENEKNISRMLIFVANTRSRHIKSYLMNFLLLYWRKLILNWLLSTPETAQNTLTHWHEK